VCVWKISFVPFFGDFFLYFLLPNFGVKASFRGFFSSPTPGGCSGLQWDLKKNRNCDDLCTLITPASCTYRFSLRIDCKVRDASLSTRCLRCQSMYNQGVFSEILQVALWKVSAHECFLISWILLSHLAGMIWVLQCTAASYCHFLLLSFILSSRLWLSPVS
jgi:hypothetical protein